MPNPSLPKDLAENKVLLPAKYHSRSAALISHVTFVRVTLTGENHKTLVTAACELKQMKKNKCRQTKIYVTK